MGWTCVESHNVGGGSGNLVLSQFTNTQEGDIAILNVYVTNASDVTAISGWTRIALVDEASTHMRTFVKTLTGSEGTVTITGSSVRAACYAAYRHEKVPLTSSVMTEAMYNSLSVTLPSVTTTADDALVVCPAVGTGVGSSNTTISGYTVDAVGTHLGAYTSMIFSAPQAIAGTVSSTNMYPMKIAMRIALYPNPVVIRPRFHTYWLE